MCPQPCRTDQRQIRTYCGTLASVLTGRQRAEQTLRPLMQEIGWKPRAAGWFTKQMAPGLLGVVAVDAASKGYERGSASISLHVGLRDQETEPVVANCCGIDDHAYQRRTVNRYIGYVMPERTFLKWDIDMVVADPVCAELVRHVVAYAEPYLRGLAQDPQVLLVEAAATGLGWPNHCRVAVQTFRVSGRDAAEQYLAGIDFDLPIHSQMLERLREWMQAA